MKKIYNPKKIGRKATSINDQFWKESYFIHSTLEEALEQEVDSEIIRILKNPNLFVATS